MTSACCSAKTDSCHITMSTTSTLAWPLRRIELVVLSAWYKVDAASKMLLIVSLRYISRRDVRFEIDRIVPREIPYQRTEQTQRLIDPLLVYNAQWPREAV
eukprot:scaffold5999_cov114-Skeletonema_dohrnii-CCMP3373.AAC.8